MDDLRLFREGLEKYLKHSHARPFVCEGSPLKCRSFIVGLNAATCLTSSFSCYWSDKDGFDRQKFDHDYNAQRVRRGNRPRIEAIAKQMAPCLETNLYAVPTSKANELTPADRLNPVICYLFQTIRPERVFVHSNEPIEFFTRKTGCSGFTSQVKRARWQGHEFWLLGQPGPLFRTSLEQAAAQGAKLAAHPMETLHR